MLRSNILYYCTFCISSHSFWCPWGHIGYWVFKEKFRYSDQGIKEDTDFWQTIFIPGSLTKTSFVVNSVFQTMLLKSLHLWVWRDFRNLGILDLPSLLSYGSHTLWFLGSLSTLKNYQGPQSAFVSVVHIYQYLPCEKFNWEK